MNTVGIRFTADAEIEMQHDDQRADWKHDTAVPWSFE